MLTAWSFRILVLTLSLFSVGSLAAEDSLLELGAGIGGLASAHYPGSDQSYAYAIPLPYVVYRGERVRADRTGVKAIIADNQKLELNVSARAGLPVDSDDNDARRDMPDLGWLFEAGPALRYIPLETDSGTRLSLEIPVRAVFSVDSSSVHHRGWTLSPGLSLSRELGGWKLAGSMTAFFGNRDYHGYFYDVAPVYATSDRPAYRAQAGYTASRLGLSVTHRTGDWYFGSFVHYYSLHGAENSHSPLLREDNNLAIGFMLSRVLYSSGKAPVHNRE